LKGNGIMAFRVVTKASRVVGQNDPTEISWEESIQKRGLSYLSAVDDSAERDDSAARND
jgi:hypothetical protein